VDQILGLPKVPAATLYLTVDPFGLSRKVTTTILTDAATASSMFGPPLRYSRNAANWRVGQGSDRGRYNCTVSGRTFGARVAELRTAFSNPLSSTQVRGQVRDPPRQ